MELSVKSIGMDGNNLLEFLISVCSCFIVGVDLFSKIRMVVSNILVYEICGVLKVKL